MPIVSIECKGSGGLVKIDQISRWDCLDHTPYFRSGNRGLTGRELSEPVASQMLSACPQWGFSCYAAPSGNGSSWFPEHCSDALSATSPVSQHPSYSQLSFQEN